MPKIAKQFSVGYKVVQKLKYQWRDLRTLKPQTHHCGRKRAFSQKQSKKRDQLIRENSSLTLEQLRQKLRMGSFRICIYRRSVSDMNSNYFTTRMSLL